MDISIANKPVVYLVWCKDVDIYRSHNLHGIYKDKLDAIQYVKDFAAKRGVDVQSEEDDSFIREYYVDPDSKLVACYNFDGSWFTVERTEVQ